MAYDFDRPPAGWVKARTRRRERRMWFAAVAFVAVTGLMLALAIGHRLTVIGSALFLAAVLAVRPYASAYIDEHLRLEAGTHAEEAVARTLNELRHDGWHVSHDVEQPGEGNIDHLVAGPNGLFLVETKLRGFHSWQLVKAKRQAAKFKRYAGVWVTPVLCLYERDGGPWTQNGVAIVPHAHLLAWLRRQRRAPASPALLARLDPLKKRASTEL